MRSKGFSLLEMAIVITIIALILGGILIGRNLVRSAELKAIVSEANEMKSAIRSFKSKYGWLPGDFIDAYRFWPSAGCTDDTVTTVDTGCNGDGNGEIYWSSWYQEGLRGWQHLALAGMIQGAYDGTRAPVAQAANRCVIGTTIPRAAGTNAGWEYLDLRNHAGLGITAKGTAIALGFPDNLCVGAGVLTPEEAQSLDSKVDDGLPLTGKFMANQTIPAWYTGTCRDAAGAGSGYNIANGARDCYLLFPLD